MNIEENKITDWIRENTMIDGALTVQNMSMYSLKEILTKFHQSELNQLSLGSVSDILTLADDNEDLIDVSKRYAHQYTIEAVKGTTPDLTKLASNQRVVYGDGDEYHFRLTKK